jgi:hypothetical protein
MKLRFWTNDIEGAPRGSVTPKHAWAAGVVRMKRNATHGIEPGKPEPFHSLLDLGDGNKLGPLPAIGTYKDRALAMVEDCWGKPKRARVCNDRHSFSWSAFWPKRHGRSGIRSGINSEVGWFCQANQGV